MMWSRFWIALGMMLASGVVAAAQGQPSIPQGGPESIPGTIPVSVSGLARDEDGRPVSNARILLISASGEPKLVAQTTAGADGHYRIEGGGAPVVRESPDGVPLPPEVTPYADFVVCGLAPGLGLAWGPPQSMYALDEPRPNDIQGRLPLGPPVRVNLDFTRTATLTGRVLDEEGKPVRAAGVQVLGADLLDEAGRETNNALDGVWQALPESIGTATTDAAGRFAIDRLPDRACFRLAVTRPEIESTQVFAYAATIAGPETVHDRLPPGSFNGRLPHKVLAGDVVIIFPRLRRVAVSIVGDDTRRPVAGVRVVAIDDDQKTGLTSSGITDHDGNAVLGLPPGQHPGISADPPTATPYLRAERRPLVVERGDGDQPCRLVLTSGCDLRIRVTEPGTSRPVSGVLFWKFPEDHPDRIEQLPSSAVRGGVLRTDESGIARAVLPPEPGRRFRFRIAGIHSPNTPDQVDVVLGRNLHYVSDPHESRPVELAAGKSVRFWFVLTRPVRPQVR